MKKIGYIIPTFPVLSETFVGVEMRAMMRHGHEVQPFAFAATERCQPADKALAEQCQYIPSHLTLSALSYFKHLPKCHQFLSAQQGFSYLSLLKQGAILAEMVKKAGCEHLHAHFAWHSAATAIVAAKILNITVSFVGHGADIYASPQDLEAKLKHANFGCAVTNDMMRHLQSQTTTPVHYVACGLEAENYPKLTSEWVPNRDFLFIGRLVEKKDLETLISAFKQLPSYAKLDIVGDGPMMSRLQVWIETRGMQNRVNLLGAQNASWLRNNARHYKSLVVPFCIASDGDRDTGPLVIKEAMGLGLPVITSDLSGCREILDAKSGTNVPMGNPYALSHAMQHILEQPTTSLNQQRAAAYERVLTYYNADLHAARLSKLVESL